MNEINTTYEKIKQTMLKIELISSEFGYPITTKDYYIENLGCPHNSKPLPKGYAGVYFFEYKGIMLKIGKANAKSNARFESQHYGFSAPSTLAKSICSDPDFIKIGVTEINVSNWMKNNLNRYNILVKKEDGKAMTELIEATMHFTFRPKYEGAIR